MAGRPLARLCRLYWRLRCLLADAHNHTRTTPRGLPNLVIWHNGEIGDVTRNGPGSGAPRTVPSSSGHRNTVLVAALSRTTLLCLRQGDLPSSFSLFLFLFCFSVCFRVCRSKTFHVLFWLVGDPRPQEFQPRRRCEAGPAAPKPMTPGNGATFLWRHAVDQRFGAAVDNTRGVVIPSPRLLLRRPPVPPAIQLVSEYHMVFCFPAALVSLGCGHRRATEGSGLYQTQPLNLPLGAPRRANFSVGSVRGLGFGVTPRVLVSIGDFTYKAFGLYGRSHPSQRALTFGEMAL